MTHDGAQPRTYDEILDDFINDFEERRDDPQTGPSDVYGAIFRSFARVLAENQEETLANVYNNLFIESAEGDALTQKCKEIGVIRGDAVAATGVVEFSTDSAPSTDRVIPAGTRVATEPPNQVRFATTDAVTLTAGSTSVRAPIEAAEPGAETNVPSGKIRLFVDELASVESVTNPIPTGDVTETDPTGSALVRGKDRESDESLRSRALEQVQSLGGAATLPAIRAALGNLEDVQSFTTYIDEGNSTIEPVVYDGTDEEIAQALFDTIAATEKTIGGVNGTAVSVDIESDLLPSGSRTINFSRPIEQAIDLTVDVAVTSEFVGKDTLRRQIVDYIGGRRPDGTETGGLEVGASPLEGELRNQINPAGDANGVVDVTGLTATPSIEADTNGVRKIPVGSNEVARVDGTDESITINVTEV